VLVYVYDATLGHNEEFLIPALKTDSSLLYQGDKVTIEGITVEVVQNTTIILKACDKEQLGFFAAKVRAWRPPEPYKGKGILYKDEKILRKAGKSGKK
jgi:large subunit ribosomal protein L6